MVTAGRGCCTDGSLILAGTGDGFNSAGEGRTVGEDVGGGGGGAAGLAATGLCCCTGGSGICLAVSVLGCCTAGSRELLTSTVEEFEAAGEERTVEEEGPAGDGGGIEEAAAAGLSASTPGCCEGSSRVRVGAMEEFGTV